LHARRVDDAGLKPPSEFEPLGADEFRTRAGGEAGERLQLHRDPDTGAVVSMHWATYRFTRTQEAFDGVGPGEPD
jgi:hypothetical protein